MWRQHRALENNVQMIQNEIADLRRTVDQLSNAIKSLRDITLNQTRATSISDAGSSGNSQDSAGTGLHTGNKIRSQVMKGKIIYLTVAKTIIESESVK